MTLSLDESAVALENETPALDLSDEQEFLRKLLGTMKLLNQFQSSFDDERAVCQAQVKALIDECEISLDDRYPLQSFTQAPSPQNLAIVTESLFRRAGSAIMSLIRKVLEMIRKMFDWIIKAIKSIFSRQKAIHQRVVVIKALAQANTEVKATTKPLAEDSQEVQKAQAALDVAIGRFKDYYSELAHALLTQSPYLGAVKATGLFMPKLASLLGEKLTLAEEYLRQPSANTSIMAQRLALLATPLPLMKLEQVAAKYAPLRGKDTLLAFFEALKAHTVELHTARPKGTMEWEIASAMVVDTRSGFDEPVVAIPDDIQRTFQALMARVDALGHPEVLSHIESTLTGQYEAAMMAILSDVHALTLYAESVNTVLDTQVGIAVSLYQCHTAQWAVHRAKAQAAQDPAAINAINALQHKLREAITNR